KVARQCEVRPAACADSRLWQAILTHECLNHGQEAIHVATTEYASTLASLRGAFRVLQRTTAPFPELHDSQPCKSVVVGQVKRHHAPLMSMKRYPVLLGLARTVRRSPDWLPRRRLQSQHFAMPLGAVPARRAIEAALFGASTAPESGGTRPASWL